MNPRDRRVAYDDLGGVGYVSTIRQSDGTFETAARIGPKYDIDAVRYTTTYGEAIAAHFGLVLEHRELMQKERQQ
jgi:hypothetical protein